MDKVMVLFKATNYDDLAANKLKLRRRKARAVEVEGLVDTGAVWLYLQRGVIAKLGLHLVVYLAKLRVGALLKKEVQGLKEKYEG